MTNVIPLRIDPGCFRRTATIPSDWRTRPIPVVLVVLLQTAAGFSSHTEFDDSDSRATLPIAENFFDRPKLAGQIVGAESGASLEIGAAAKKQARRRPALAWRFAPEQKECAGTVQPASWLTATAKYCATKGQSETGRPVGVGHLATP